MQPRLYNIPSSRSPAARALVPLLIGALAFLAPACKKAATPTAASHPPTVTINVGFLPVSTSLPNHVAVSEGLMAGRGVEVNFKRFANANLMLAALLSGEIQATSVLADEPILGAASRGTHGFEIYLQEMLSDDRTFDAIVVRVDSPIKSLADLRGRTVAAFPGTQLKTFLKIILRDAGVDPGEVKVIELPPPNMLPSLESKSIDAAFVLEPTISIGSARGVTRILVPSPIVKYIGGGKPICAASFLIATAWADAHPGAADAFVRAVHEAVKRIEDNYPACAKLYPKFTPIPAELAERVVVTRFTGNDAPDLKGLSRELSILTEAGAMGERAVDLKSLVYRWRTGAAGVSRRPMMEAQRLNEAGAPE